MSIAVSMISEFMFCPMKVYLRELLGISEPGNRFAIRLRDTYLDFRAAAESRARKIDEDIRMDELESILREDLGGIIRGLDETERDKIMDLMLFEVESTANRIMRAMNTLGLSGDMLAHVLFPPLIRDYPINDPSLEIHGRVTMELVDGSYYPLKIKTSKPPFRGVWPADSLELTAQAILVEREFETETMVSFIEYMLPGERRPVLADYGRREYLFDILDDIRRIKDDGEVPEVQVNPSKCAGCGLAETCSREFPFK